MVAEAIRRTAVAALGALGVLVTLFFLFGGEAGLGVRVLQVLLPLVLSVGLSAFGGSLVREDVSTAVIWTTAKAMLAGAGLFAFIVFWIVTVQEAAGTDLPNQDITYLNAVLFGAAMFTIVGYLYAQLEEQTTRLHRRSVQLRKQTERLDEFASLVSHDLRNPLTVAQGNLELARRAGEPAEHIEKATAALERMEELLSGMLTLARHGQIIETTSPIAISAVARTAWEYVPAPDAELRVEDDLTVQADAARLEQVFENLFRNAIEHGGPDVVVRVGAINSAGFYVEDSGPGLPATDSGEVFEMGFSTDEHGTGYGLAIVNAIVEAHGWTITAREGATGGARFEIAV